MVLSALYILVVFANADGALGAPRPTVPIEIGRYERAICLDQATLGNRIGERGLVYRCIPAGPFQAVDRPTR